MRECAVFEGMNSMGVSLLLQIEFYLYDISLCGTMCDRKTIMNVIHL